MIRVGQTLYLCGDFNAVNGHYRPQVAAVSTVTGELLPWSPRADGPIDAIAATDQVVYLAGSFNYVNGELRQFIAATEPSFGLTTAWHPILDAAVHRVLFAFNQL